MTMKKNLAMNNQYIQTLGQIRMAKQNFQFSKCRRKASVQTQDQVRSLWKKKETQKQKSLKERLELYTQE